MTPERLEQIRAINSYTEMKTGSLVRVKDELLVEIDRLRSLQDGETDWHSIAKELEKERDQLKAENEKLQKNLFIAKSEIGQIDATAKMIANIQEIAIDRDQLTAANEYMAAEYTMIESERNKLREKLGVAEKACDYLRSKMDLISPGDNATLADELEANMPEGEK